MLVDVYKNLHNSLWSIRDVKTNLVVGYAKTVELKDCKLIVCEAGRQRVLREKQKNVHAYVRGSIKGTIGFKAFKNRTIPTTPAISLTDGYSPNCSLYYNPYKVSSFVDKLTGCPVTECDHVLLSNNVLYD